MALVLEVGVKAELMQGWISDAGTLHQTLGLRFCGLQHRLLMVSLQSQWEK